jgi:hypothetical protein
MVNTMIPQKSVGNFMKLEPVLVRDIYRTIFIFTV